jgi:hypothetical protein
MGTYVRQVSTILAFTTGIAVTLSLLWRIPYIFTFVGVAALILGGHFVTIDEDLPGEWSNPDGLAAFPWDELMLKIAVLILLAGLALVPQIRALG